MRILLLITALFFLTNCTVAEDETTSGEGGNTGTTTKDVQFKTINGSFETMSTDNITQLKVAVSDSTGGTTVIRTYSLPESSNRARDLGFDEPGTKDIAKLKQTGTVELQFIAEGTTQVVTRNFAIFNHQYIQDSMFPDVIYNSTQKITFDWFEAQ